jgi:hypothetical protein
MWLRKETDMIKRRQCAVKGCRRWERIGGFCGYHFEMRWGFKYKGPKTTEFIQKFIALMSQYDIKKVNGFELD